MAYDAHYFRDSVLNEVHFGWAGSVEEGEPHYYRVQGLSILVEYKNNGTATTPTRYGATSDRTSA
ncbi:DUF3500 domain-containing protein [Spirillospora sp. NPDC046719]